MKEKDTGYLELLLFRLPGHRPFGINVLKVNEIIPCPPLTQIPQSHYSIKGVTHLRGESVAVIDLSVVLGGPALTCDCHASVVVTSFNRQRQGFLVEGVDRIVLKNWQEISSPPKAAGSGIFVSGVTRVDDWLIQILDVERLLAQVLPTAYESPETVQDDRLIDLMSGKRILVVDDSSIALNQTTRVLNALGLETCVARNGREALEYLHSVQGDILDTVPVVISDIEMPELDGYALTAELKNDPRFQALYVLLHTSLNSSMDLGRAERSGADAFLTKFVPQELADATLQGIEKQLDLLCVTSD